MATVVLQYDVHNQMAQKTLEYILSLGFFEKIHDHPFAESDDDISKGRVYAAKDADDLIEKCIG